MSGEVAAQIRVSRGPGGRAADTPAGSLALSALNAVAGDRLGPGMAPLTIGLTVRAAGRDVDLTTEELAAAFTQATLRLAVFVHGLGANEDLWRWRSEGEQRVPYRERLRAEFADG